MEKLNKIPELLQELNPETVEIICSVVIEELRHQGFSESASTFLQDHLTDIMSGIADPEIAALPPMADFNF